MKRAVGGEQPQRVGRDQFGAGKHVLFGIIAQRNVHRLREDRRRHDRLERVGELPLEAPRERNPRLNPARNGRDGIEPRHQSGLQPGKIERRRLRRIGWLLDKIAEEVRRRIAERRRRRRVRTRAGCRPCRGGDAGRIDLEPRKLRH